MYVYLYFWSFLQEALMHTKDTQITSVQLNKFLNVY